MDLYGKALTPRQLHRRVGRLEQKAGIEPFVLGEGSARGVRPAAEDGGELPRYDDVASRVR